MSNYNHLWVEKIILNLITNENNLIHFIAKQNFNFDSTLLNADIVKSGCGYMSIKASRLYEK